MPVRRGGGSRAHTYGVDGELVNFNSDTSLFQSVFLLADVTLGPADTDFTLTRFGNAGSTINAAVLTQAPAAAAVPEPASIALWSILGLAVAGFVVLHRRRR